MKQTRLLSLLLLLPVCAILGAQEPSGFPSFSDQYQIPFPKAIRNAPDTVSIVIIGDVMMHAKQLERDHRTFLEQVAPALREADFAVANMEFPLGGEPYTGYPSFSTPDYYARYAARDCGIDVFLTGNNHVLDRGSKGLRRTLDVYAQLRDSLGVRQTGAARDRQELEESYPLILSRHGIRIALVNFTYGTNSGQDTEWPKINYMRREEVAAAIRRARRQDADFVIALPHWGTEYRLQHDANQQSWAEWLVGEGVDAIVGSHPHVVQDSTHIQGVPVIYSLGNAISNMSIINSRLGLAATLRFVDDPVRGGKRMLEPELRFLWCTLPGMLLPDSYASLFVKEWANRRNDWLTPDDFDNMISTWERVKDACGIED
ncbi:MAG: CapA family protein [Bacteroidales bacterium]|nr:CapA family protein [Bacteroidales bacterium]